ncbi:MAG: ABC transporter ATP-binding protein, partial [Actinomycetota bacterium]|nr:ABC transporter ATP-binding protein [Actinomycetota bacterium]
MRFRRAPGVGSPDLGERTLIGVDDVTTPAWAKVSETMAGSGIGRMLRAAPVAVGVLVRLAWQTSPRLTLLAAAAELVAGCATAFG